VSVLPWKVELNLFDFIINKPQIGLGKSSLEKRQKNMRKKQKNAGIFFDTE
jgi:hypothetical protein